jgi:pimeloyl-ACP methyl ester carboxylesterase
LRDISKRPAEIPAQVAIQAASDMRRARGWPRFFRHTRRLRFEGGQEIDVPIVLAFGEHDRISPQKKSRRLDQLPAHTTLETWEGCGHNLVWDDPDRVLATIARVTNTDPTSGHSTNAPSFVRRDHQSAR